jgi:hypothetical protein
MTSPVAVIVGIPHVIKGDVVRNAAVSYLDASGGGFVTPELDLSTLYWPRTEPLPAAGVPVSEIIDLLVATGERLRQDPDGLVAQALEALIRTSPYERRILERSYESLGKGFTAKALRAQLDSELGGAEVVDGWVTRSRDGSKAASVRAYPARLVHILAGNGVSVPQSTIGRGALMKGVHLLKLPSNDLLTATAVLRTMASVAPGHPTVRSFSAVYWPGGDQRIESAVFRPQFFDKVVAWGGEAPIRNVAKYLGPGLELISFDPKNSISMIGCEGLGNDTAIGTTAALAAADSTYLNQEACTTSRFQFVEGTEEQVDRYCETLQAELGEERRYTSARVSSLPIDLREEINALRMMEPMYRVFGEPDGRGVVIRSTEPVDFYPTGKTVNVVVVNDLREALRYVNLSTQTVGVYPASRRLGLRDALAAAGAQRVIALGSVEAGSTPGMPHDGFFPLNRMVHWVSDEGEIA